jgi:hypothetical protein
MRRQASPLQGLTAARGGGAGEESQHTCALPAAGRLATYVLQLRENTPTTRPLGTRPLTPSPSTGSPASSGQAECMRGTNNSTAGKWN